MRVVESCSPARAPTWLLGSRLGVQVWEVTEDPRIWVSILVGESPIVLLNRVVVGTAREGAALNWALARLALDGPGFYICPEVRGT